MTTTTADKGELLPLPEGECCEWMQHGKRVNAFPYPKKPMSEQSDYERKYWVPKGYDAAPLFTAKQMREYALANMNRQTNEGQDGLTGVMRLAAKFGARIMHGDGQLEYLCFPPGAIHDFARHLSSKKADHPEQHLEIVKADAVEMPEPDGYLWRGTILNEDWKYAPLSDKDQMEYMLAYRYKGEVCHEVKPIYFDATAHTAEAVRELVEGLKQARETINLLWLSHHANRSDAAIEACDALLAKCATSQEGKA